MSFSTCATHARTTFGHTGQQDEGIGPIVPREGGYDNPNGGLYLGRGSQEPKDTNYLSVLSRCRV